MKARREDEAVMEQCMRYSNLCSERLSEQHVASIEVTMYDGDGVEVGQAIGHIL